MVLRELSPQAARADADLSRSPEARRAAAICRWVQPRRSSPSAPRPDAAAGDPGRRDDTKRRTARGLGRASATESKRPAPSSSSASPCTATAATGARVRSRRRELVVTAGVQKMAPGLRVALPAAASRHSHEAGRPMKSFNLTEWALDHRAIVLFLIIAIAVGGMFSFTKLGQLEDPNFSVPSMTALVIWPGATAQQMQDEVLNRMEKKFEQLDHFEKVVTYARQGYGGMTLTVQGGTSKADQREAWYQARKKLSDIKLDLPARRRRSDLQRRVRRRVRIALRGQGRRHRSCGAGRHRRGHQAPPAEGADGQEGGRLRQAGRRGSTSSSRTNASPRSASRRARSSRACAPERFASRAGRSTPPGDRVHVRVSGPVHEPGRHPQRADRGGRAR